MIPYFQPPSLSLGPFNLQVFGIFAAAGVYTGAVVASRAARRQGLPVQPLADFAIWGVASGVLFGHLIHLFLYHPEELSDWRKVLEFWQGLSSFGGLLGGILAAAVFFRRRGLEFHDYGDALALGVAPGWGVARLGCFAIHDHPGVHTSFPLAVNFPDGPRHDLGLYDAVVLFALAALLFLLRRRGLLRGRLLAVLALLYACSRFFLDFLRASDVPYPDARYLGLTPAQYGSLLLVGYAAWRFSKGAPTPTGAVGTVRPAGR
ncbi:MAG TPA: prolipoprotein diacylglyceryl transferase family protein [Anaeromyxobacteraceae bacterium]|nr:prolipoprotein diacylglyceryl transferase family protein [Anaeromyxobacteraceae bacterium]